MMLVQKAQPALLSSPAQFSHRRHPSAPVVVQPTHVPGLLILSKPPRPTPSRQHQQQHLNRNQGRIQPKNGPKPSISTPVRAQTLIPAAEITDNIKTATTAPATPSPQSRGRSHAKISKEKNKRSLSQSSLRPKQSRQPSPPIPAPQKHHQSSSPAEVPIKSDNPFDPFIDHSSDHTIKSGSRRQSKAIPVPSTARKSQTPSLPSSVPLFSRPMFQQRSQRPRPLLPKSLPDFPICDDMSEIADDDHHVSTPRRFYDFAPKTAPVSPPSASGFPFGDVAVLRAAPPSPISPMKNSNRRHRRTPSDGVFHMSSDEEVSSGPGGALLNPNVKALFGLVNTPVPASKMRNPLSHSATPTPLKGLHTSTSAVPNGVENSTLGSMEKAGFFASSMFQNSPSPDELPDPLLL